MDGFTFTAELINSLSWPITTIILVMLLRKPIINLIPFLKRLKYKELELEFSQEILELKAETQESFEVEVESTPQITANTNRLEKLLTISTHAAIMESWIELETAAVNVASQFWGEPPSDIFRNMSDLGEYLYKSGVITQEQVNIFNKLREIRNKVAHAQEVKLSIDDARSYIEMASKLAIHIKMTNVE